jgi:methylenetetrahydrofolate dehydrogenase (NADP+)/methenyltetrahydrofolate cyclohydrolase
MSASIIDGKKIAADIKQEAAQETELLRSKGIVPGLATVLVGEDPASQTYVGMKRKTCEELGMRSDLREARCRHEGSGPAGAGGPAE